MPRPVPILLAATGTVAVAFVLGYLLLDTHPPEPPKPATTATAATTSTSAPASRPVVADYTAFLVSVSEAFKDARPIDPPVSLTDASAVVSDRPVYLDPRGDLWITHPDARPIEAVLPTAHRDDTHLVREQVVYCLWLRDARGNFVAQPVTRDSSGGFLWHAPAGPVPLARRDYRFDRASLMIDGRLLVPTDVGVVAITPPPPTAIADAPTAPAEAFAPLPGRTPVLVFPVARDHAVAFRPWDNGDTGSDIPLHLPPKGTWAPVDVAATEFPDRPVHVFPMTDGSLLVLFAVEDGGLAVDLIKPFDPRPADPGEVRRQVAALSRGTPESRREAQIALVRLGPAAWHLMEDLRDAQPPDAQTAIDRILGYRAKPALGIFTLLPGPARILYRAPDGSLALQLFGGVSYLDLGKETERGRAVLLARAGAVRLAPTAVTHRRTPDGDMIEVGEELDLQFRADVDELFVTDPDRGPLRLLGNHLQPLLRDDLTAFRTFLGIDRKGRWILRAADARTLLLDPNYADPTPRLPAWHLSVSTSGATGWDPAGNLLLVNRGTWKLGKSGWESIPPTTTPALRTAPTASELKRQARVVLPDARAVTAGPDRLVISAGAGKPESTVLLPPELRGSLSPTLLLSHTGHLLLFNQPGKAHRFKPVPAPAPDATRPASPDTFTPDATFTEEIPTLDVHDPRRIWLDPLGRVCIAYGDTGLTVLFPEGRIPRELANLVTTRKLPRPEPAPFAPPGEPPGPPDEQP